MRDITGIASGIKVTESEVDKNLFHFDLDEKALSLFEEVLGVKNDSDEFDAKFQVFVEKALKDFLELKTSEQMDYFANKIPTESKTITDSINLVEQAAGKISEELIATMESDIVKNWADIACQIAKHKDEAALFFEDRVICLAEIYTQSMDLFVKIDSNSDLLNGVEVEQGGLEPSTNSEQ